MGLGNRSATFVTRAVPVSVVEMAWNVNDLGDGDFTITVGARPTLYRGDGSPSQAGDVLSCQVDGSLQTRPAGTTGVYERCRPNGNLLVFRPAGPNGSAYGVAYAANCPNPE